MLGPSWRSPLTFPESAQLDTATPGLLAALAAAAPHRVAVIDGDREISYAHLLAGVAGWQQRLRSAGVRRGDVVGAQLPNWWETVALAHAVWGMGAVLCPIPVNYRRAELTAIGREVELRAVVVPHRYRGVDHGALVAGALGERSGARVLAVREPGSTADRAAAPPAELAAELDAVCLLMFTSGTTGRPKGVLHSHRSLLADAASIARLFGMSGDRVYMPSPLGHITGLVYGVLMPLLMDGSCVLQAEWDADAGVELVERHGCTTCVGATPFLRGLVEEYRRRGQASALRSFICGGADVPAALIREATIALDAVVTRAYGLTEMPTVTCGGPSDPEWVRCDTDGRLTGSSRARLARDPAAAEPVGDGVGELEVCGPELCLGYLDPEQTAAAFTADGWFRTGDLARLTGSDTVTIVGRAKDIVVRGGENIGVKEVEDYLLEHPAVVDVAVVGVPDERLGERACAVVVPRGELTLRQLGAFLLERDIAKHKLPEYLLVVDHLPRTPSGKVQKFRLRELAAERLARGEGERR